jgi:hypothetical protein
MVSRLADALAPNINGHFIAVIYSVKYIRHLHIYYSHIECARPSACAIETTHYAGTTIADELYWIA